MLRVRVYTLLLTTILSVNSTQLDRRFDATTQIQPTNPLEILIHYTTTANVNL